MSSERVDRWIRRGPNYEFNGDKARGITKDWLPRLFWPEYDWQAANFIERDQLAIEASEQPKIPIFGGRKTNAMQLGAFRGLLLERQFKTSVELLALHSELPRDLFARSENRKRLSQLSPLPQAVCNLLGVRSTNLLALWREIRRLRVEPKECQVVCGWRELHRATAVDIDSVHSETGHHILFELKTGHAKIYRHTNRKLKAPFSDQTDCLLHQYWIQLATTVIFYEVSVQIKGDSKPIINRRGITLCT